MDVIDLAGGPWGGYTLAQDLNVISMEGERLATLSELQALFAVIGPFTPAMDGAYGTGFFPGDWVYSAGIFDQGGGVFGLMFGYFDETYTPPYYDSFPWSVAYSSIALSDDPATYGAGLWVVSVPKIAGCNAVTLSGNALVDSYNSTDGSYASQVGARGHTWNDDNVLQTYTYPGASITLSGNAAVYGNASATGSVITSGHAEVYGIITENPPTTYPLIVPFSDCDPLNVANLVANNRPSGSPTGISLSGNKTETLAAPGPFYLSGVSLSGNSVLKVSGTGNAEMFIDGDLSVSGQASFIVSNGVKLAIYITGNISIAGGGIVNQGPPTDLVIYASATKGGQVTISGNSDFSGALYAPFSNISVAENSAIMGGVRGMTVTGSGQRRFSL